MDFLVAIAGRPGAGKTSLAGHLTSSLGFVSASFGDVVRREARLRAEAGLIPSLRDLGVALIEEWGWEKFCSEALKNAVQAEHVAVDGVRHVAAVDELRRRVPSGRFALFFVRVAETTRRARLVARDGTETLVEPHSVERETDLLLQLADVVVNTDDEGDLAGAISWVRRELLRGPETRDRSP